MEIGGLAITMLEKSREGGRIKDKFTSFDSCRQLRSTISNSYMATAEGNKDKESFKSLSGIVFYNTKDPTQSMKTRMPVASARNLPLTGVIVNRVLDEIEWEMLSLLTSDARRRLLVMVGGYMKAFVSLVTNFGRPTFLGWS